jgi:hypothetical protein
MAALCFINSNDNRRWYQFSLRSLMIFVTLFAIGCSIFTVVMRKNIRFWKSPCHVLGGSGFERQRAEYQHVECRVSTDHYDDYYYGMVMGYVDFDPNLPEHPCTFTEHYDMDQGGQLSVNGKAVELSPEKWLLALNPFGQMEEIILSQAEQKLACSGDANRIWNEVVLKRLYRRQGKTDAGRPVGHWTYSDNNGKLAYEGSYKQGDRDGKWTYYYPDGTVRAKISYTQGKLDGDSTYFDDQGALKKTIQWKNDYPVGETVRQIGLEHQQMRTPSAILGGRR